MIIFIKTKSGVSISEELLNMTDKFINETDIEEGCSPIEDLKSSETADI